MTAGGSHNLGPYLVPLLVIGVVALRLVRNKPRKVRPNRLFILPALLTLAAGFALSQMPAPGWIWYAVYIVAGTVGLGVGYLSGRHREFTLDPGSQEIMARATPTGTILFAALFAIRYGLKFIASGGNPYAPPAHPAANAIGWTDAGLVFSVAMLLATATTTWWRTRHLVAERQGRTAQSGEAAPRGLG
ncbi:MAG TPA: hypothetical protein VLC74_03705 [Rhizomicrobium sp.]|nr:hypothetical protein [Rhizomicrobium sp.]